MNEEEWERRRQAHQETQERGWTTVREAREMEDDSIPVIISPSGLKQQAHAKEVVEYEAVDIEAAPKKGRTIKSRIKSKLRKIKSENPKIEIVDEEMEAARKKGYDAHMKEKRDKEIIKAEKQGRRDAMTFKSRRVDDAKKLQKGAGIVAGKVKPVAKRVGKNAKGLARELAATPGQIAQTIGQTAIEMEKVKQHAKKQAAKTTTTQRKEKPGPAVRKGTIGRHEGGLPVKSHKSGPGRRVGGLPVKSTKPGPGTRSKHGPVARSGYKPPHKSTKPAPTNNIPKATAVVNRQRSVNFAMRKRSRK
ncbi:hypothetical protein [Methanosarcina sp.]|uniref:hypothetical protein n=1 Tax=Methanosarcina sp. TaxID=2213 RepID=UPI002D1604EA|nr:hypothetical protein [Methanosarcina sp.]HOW13509.1 hypothetical protein [Methanosarcina sp.]